MQYTVRQLKESDIGEQLFETISHLSSCDGLTLERGLQIFKAIMANPAYTILVASNDDGVIGMATLLIEQKFIHNGGRVGHIEDVVTSPKHQNQGVASAIINKLLDIARTEHCYKVILDCNEKDICFYERFGFTVRETGMRLDL